MAFSNCLHFRSAVKHFVYPRRRSRCTGQHHKYHGHHDQGHEYMQAVLDERHEPAQFQVACVYPAASDPYDANGYEVNGQIHQRHQAGHKAVNLKRGLHVILACLIEPSGLIVNAVKRPYHPDAGEPFPEHQIELVQLCLQQLKHREHFLGHDVNYQGQYRQNGNKQHRQLGFPGKCKYDASDEHHGRGHEYAQRHKHHRLHL